jgi:hypothetical protein
MFLPCKNNKQALKNQIDKNKDSCYIIHYACEAINQSSQFGLSPAVTSITIMHYGTRDTKSFSIHRTAENLGHKTPEALKNNFDAIEKDMLDRFFKHLSKITKTKLPVWFH